MDERANHYRILTSRGEFQDAIRQAFEQASIADCREIYISDPDFADWPLGERALVDHLTQWGYAHRRFTMLARGYDEVVRRHARWVAWRRQWAHIVDCRALLEVEEGQFPSMVLIPGVVVVRLVDPVHHRAIQSSDAADLIQAKELLDASLQRSEASFPAAITGL